MCFNSNDYRLMMEDFAGIRKLTEDSGAPERRESFDISSLSSHSLFGEQLLEFNEKKMISHKHINFDIQEQG